MDQLYLVVFDVIAIAVITFGLYFRRHHRRDMVVAYLVANVGVMAVTATLASSAIGAGLGLGLFGILSIIRLRSTELDHQEIAYYFAALAIGLLSGLALSPVWLSPILMALVILALYVGDHPDLFALTRSQSITLDAAYTDEDELRARLESLLQAQVLWSTVRELDLIRDTTIVDVRYRLRSPKSPAEVRTSEPRVLSR